MKGSLSNKIIMTLMFGIPIIIVITVFLIAFKPWDHYGHNGPLAVSQDNKVYKVHSPKVKVKEGVVLGGLHFPNKTGESIQIVSIKPSNISSDMTFKVLGVSNQNIKSLKYGDYSADPTKYNVKKLPFNIPAGSSDYQPVVELVPEAPGSYSMDGLIITYKYKNQQYREFYPDQFSVTCPPEVVK